MELYVLDKSMDVVDVITAYEGIVWTTKLHEPGTFKATFIFNEKTNRMLQRGNLIYKTDEIEPAVITRRYLVLNKAGEETIMVQGYMASRLLNQRIIWNKMILTGTPEEAMRKMVYEQVIDPADKKRKMPLIELGELHGCGGSMNKQVTYDNLQEALTDIAKVYELGYRMRINLDRKKLLFEVYRGVDRRMNTENQCVFTRTLGNVFEQEYSEDDTNYRNVCLVGGSGEDTARTLVAVGNAEGLERYEMFYNAAGMSNRDITDAEYRNQLVQRGNEKLAGYYIANAFESKINRKRISEFALGDYVTCSDPKWNVTVNTQIKAIEKGLSQKENSVMVTFGDEVPTLIHLIKAKE